MKSYKPQGLQETTNSLSEFTFRSNRNCTGSRVEYINSLFYEERCCHWLYKLGLITDQLLVRQIHVETINVTVGNVKIYRKTCM